MDADSGDAREGVGVATWERCDEMRATARQRILSLNKLTILILSALGICGCQSERADWPEVDASILTRITHVDTLRTPDHSSFVPSSTVGIQLRNGRFALADSYEQSIAVFDSTSTLVEIIGRRGGGPGEFQSIGGIFSLLGDSIMAFDPIANRLLVFDGVLGNSTDQVLAEWAPERDIQTTLVGRFRDGR